MTTKSIEQFILDRKTRGAAIVATDANAVAQTSHHHYLVRGSKGSDYRVSFDNGPRCSCEDFARNGGPLGTCKHIEAARLFSRAWALIDRDGMQLTTMRAMVEASTGSELHRRRWEAVLTILRLRAPAAIECGPVATLPATMPPIVDLRDYYPTAA
jgi:hypothetical protein